MDRIKSSVFVLLTIAALSSCNKSYECTCTYITTATAGEAAGISKEVMGKNRTQAEAKCRRMGNPASNDCVLK